MRVCACICGCAASFHTFRALTCADETPLTLFNSSSASAQAYPVYVCNGLLRNEHTSAALDVVALLPTYDETQHPMCTKDQHSMNRTVLNWTALGLVLQEFMTLIDDEDAPESFLRIGECDGVQAYASVLLWLGGAGCEVGC